MKNRIIILIFISFLNLLSYNPNHLKTLTVTGSCPGCDLSNAYLQGLKLSHANFDGANLSGANLSGARLDYATFRPFNGKRAQLIGTNFNSSILNNANFHKADLTNAQIVSANLWQSDFSDATLTNTNFYYSRLIEANLQRAKFSNTIFKKSDLYRANLLKASGNMIADYCAGSPNCPRDYCSYQCTNFCCTVMPNGSTYSDPYAQLCLSDRKNTCRSYWKLFKKKPYYSWFSIFRFVTISLNTGYL